MTNNGAPRTPGNGGGRLSEGQKASGADQPSISVIIPSYNRHQWLEEILASIAVQTLPFERFEVIVVDDGSEDATREVAQKAAQKPYPFQLRYFYQTNKGDAAARNLGVQQSAAEFLVFFDDDIIPEPDYLANLVAAHDGHLNRILVGTDTLWVEDANPMAVGAHPPLPAPGQPPLEPLPFVEVCSNNMSIRREAYLAVGQMEGLDFPGSSIWCDVDFTYRAAQQGFAFLRSSRARCWHRDYVAKDFQTRKKRMREVAFRAVALFHKYPELVNHLPMFMDKTPVDWKRDSFGLVVRKWVRVVTSSKWVLWALEKGLRQGNDRAREALGRWIIGGMIYRGYREGLRKFGPVPVAQTHFSPFVEHKFR